MVYFISDVHLGSLAMPDAEAHQQRFVEWLDRVGQDADAVYLLGDIFDYWYESVWPNRRHFARFTPALDALQRLTQRCPVHFYVGNHDMWTWGWLTQRTGVQVHYEPEMLTICGKRCFLGHGDGLGDEKNRRFKALLHVFQNPVAQFLFRLVPPFASDCLGYHWAAASRRKELAQPELYRGENNEPLLNFAKSYCLQHVSAQDENGVPETAPVDYFIFGHRHIELSLMLPSRACVFILGDFFRQFTYAQMDNEGVLTILADGEAEDEHDYYSVNIGLPKLTL